MITSAGRSSGNCGSPYTVAEHRALFRPNQYMRPTFNLSKPLKKRNKIALWKHNFICLANTYDDLVPSNIAKVNLIRAVAWGLARGVYLVALTTQPSLEDYNVVYSVHACAARYNN